MDTRELRHAFGRFPTGISVLVARGIDGQLAGMTANSVTCLGSTPPRLVWSLGRQSRSRAIFEQAEHFCVNVLGEGQMDLARRMAGPGDRFAGLAWAAAGEAGLPLFEGCAAWFGCRRLAVYEVGDHVTFLGGITHHHRGAQLPLLYAGGQYARLIPDCGQAAA